MTSSSSKTNSSRGMTVSSTIPKSRSIPHEQNVAMTKPTPSSSSSSSSSFSRAVRGAVAKMRPDPAYWDDCDRVIGRIQRYCADLYWGERVEVRPFGSYAQRTALRGSDVDLALIFHDRLDRFDVDVHDKDKWLKQEKIDVLKRLARDLRRYSGSCRVITQVWFAKIPLLKLVFDEVLETDVSVGKGTSGATDEKIRELLEQKDWVAAGFFAVKMWVKRRLMGVPDKTPAFYGLINSFSWVLLYLFFCIERGYIQSYEALAKKKKEDLLCPPDRSVSKDRRDSVISVVPSRRDNEEEGDVELSDDEDDAQEPVAKRRKVETTGRGKTSSTTTSTTTALKGAVSKAGSKTRTTTSSTSINLLNNTSTAVDDLFFPPEELFEQFLCFLESLVEQEQKQLSGKKLSVRCGKRVPVSSDGSDFSAEVLWVEDPAQPSNNAARSVRVTGWAIVKYEVERTLKLLRADNSRADGAGGEKVGDQKNENEEEDGDTEEEGEDEKGAREGSGESKNSKLFNQVFAEREIGYDELNGRIDPGGTGEVLEAASASTYRHQKGSTSTRSGTSGGQKPYHNYTNMNSSSATSAGERKTGQTTLRPLNRTTIGLQQNGYNNSASSSTTWSNISSSSTSSYSTQQPSRNGMYVNFAPPAPKNAPLRPLPKAGKGLDHYQRTGRYR
ncbi:unnamed protein product [Amoebophrya sp. A25]|nr:unnamed protein product [Amoebophrya sp. A25]|eukprot:GSA25T00018632001.1